MNKQKVINSLVEIKIKIDEIIKEVSNFIDTKNVILEHSGNFLLEPKKELEIYKKIVSEAIVTTNKESDKIQEDFIELQKLLNSEEWPESVLNFQIVDENLESEKMDRAEGIVDLIIEEPVLNKKILDFGCGEGHVSKYISSQKAAISVGYDIKKPEYSNFNWEEKNENFLLTNDFKKVEAEGPYDAIVLYDVIDHLTENPIEILSKLKNILNENGKIYVRCHPWCSRHGAHLYRKINKAFVHLVFTEEELNSLGYKVEETNLKVLFPILKYQEIFKGAGVKDIRGDIERQKVEDFFDSNNLVKSRIMRLFNTNSLPTFQMQQCFLDYTLTKQI